MHLHFPFTTTQVLWTLTFAAQLVLLVVLLGRDRIKRYPWFTASMTLFTLRLLAEVLLGGRMPVIVLQAIFIPLGVLMALVSLLVIVEMARRAFGGAQRQTWMIGSLSALAIAGGVLAAWGPWPHPQDLAVDSGLALLRLLQFIAQKTDMLVDLLTVELGLLVALFGSRFQAGWRSHTQRIVIGLSTVSLGWLAIQATWQMIARNIHPHNQAEYEHVMGLGTKLVSANKVIYVAVLVWWIACLWRDELGTGLVTETLEAPAPEAEDAPAENAPQSEL
jgi:hypothetical protein